MFHALFALTALTLTSPALACGDGDCANKACKTKPMSEVETAMAEVEKAEGSKIALDVDGMSCGSCSDKVTAALRAIDGVNAAAVSHQAGEARVAFDSEKVDVDKMVAAITGLGFKAQKQEKAG
jgi:copper chaperone CopZ